MNGRARRLRALLGRLALIVGVALLIFSALVAFVVPGLAVKFPTDLDETPVATGVFSLYVDRTTHALLEKPANSTITVRPRLHTVAGSASRVVLREDTVATITGRPTLTLSQQYVFDRKTLRGVRDPRAFAYTPDAVVNRTGIYSDNLPFGVGDGPFPLWQNEIGRAVSARRDGPVVHANGLTLVPLRSTVTKVPATAGYIRALAPQGIPSSLTAAQIIARAPDFQIDPVEVANQVLTRLTPADRSRAVALLSQATPLHYLMDIDNRILVEKRTGSFTQLTRFSQTLSARPDMAAISAVLALVEQPRYASVAPVATFAQQLGKVVASPPLVPVFSWRFSQTPTSFAQVAAYVKQKSDLIGAVETTIPLSLLIAGIVLVAFWAVARSTLPETIRGRLAGTPAPTPRPLPEPPRRTTARHRAPPARRGRSGPRSAVTNAGHHDKLPV